MSPESEDDDLIDSCLFGVSPEAWLSYIKYADAVFTASFHATVFSHIFQKQYFVFKRSANDQTTTRIYGITDILETANRFCDCDIKETLEYILNQKNIGYTCETLKFKELKRISYEFLKKCLEKK